MDSFEVTWEAEDGYCGGSRPHSFYIRADAIDSEMTEDELRQLFNEELMADFREKVDPTTDDEDAFIAWAKEQQQKQESE